MANPVDADSEKWCIGFGMYFTVSENRDYLRISKRFFMHWREELLYQNAELIDPEGNVFTMRVGLINGNPYFTEGLQNIIHFYSLSGRNYVNLRYRPMKKFEMRILNPSNIEINYPKKKQTTVIVIDSDSEDEIHPKLSHWKRTVTLGHALGKNPLPIPARIVNNVFLKGQREVLLLSHQNVEEVAAILTIKKMRKSERYLDKAWYKFCHKLNLNLGDLISFSFAGGPYELKVAVKWHNV